MLCGRCGGVSGRIGRHVSISAASLQRALDARELFVHYQPIVELATRRWVGAEALVRWRLPDGTLVCPSQFMPLAERYGLAHSVSARVLELVRGQAGAVFARCPGFYISVNVSVGELESMRTVDALRSTMVAMGAHSGRFHVEISERGQLGDSAMDTIRALRHMGVVMSIDDFGTGHANLSYLARFEVDRLKLDKLFMRGIGTGDASDAIVGRLIELARDLNLEVIAEGVESSRQADFLMARGVRFAQGWLFAPAMPMAALLAHMRHRAWFRATKERAGPGYDGASVQATRP